MSSIRRQHEIKCPHGGVQSGVGGGGNYISCSMCDDDDDLSDT